MSEGWIGDAIEVGGALLIAIGGGFIHRHGKRLENIETNQQKDHDRIADHMIYSEQEFAKEKTLQFSLNRIHDRLDETAKEFRETLERHAKESREAMTSVQAGIQALTLEINRNPK